MAWGLVATQPWEEAGIQTRVAAAFVAQANLPVVVAFVAHVWEGVWLLTPSAQGSPEVCAQALRVVLAVAMQERVDPIVLTLGCVLPLALLLWVVAEALPPSP